MVIAVLNIEERSGSKPDTNPQPPHLQITQQSPREVYNALNAWVFNSFDLVREEPTRISVPTSRAMWLQEDVPASTDVFMPPLGSREFAHIRAIIVKTERNGDVTQQLKRVRVFGPKVFRHRETVRKQRSTSHSFVGQAMQELVPWRHLLVGQVSVEGQSDRRVSEIIWIGFVDDLKCGAEVSGPQKADPFSNFDACVCVILQLVNDC